MKSLYPLLIGGQWRESDDIMDVINPFNNQTVAKVCRATSDHAELALTAAQGARATMASLSSHLKADILRKVSEKISARREEIARNITLENGKPINESRSEADRAALTFRIASEEATRINGEFISL